MAMREHHLADPRSGRRTRLARLLRHDLRNLAIAYRHRDLMRWLASQTKPDDVSTDRASAARARVGRIKDLIIAISVPDMATQDFKEWCLYIAAEYSMVGQFLTVRCESDERRPHPRVTARPLPHRGKAR